MTPSKGRIKLVNLEIAYRYVCLLAIQNHSEVLLNVEKNEELFG